MTTQLDNRIFRLGIDIGRVIIDGASHPNGGDTAFFSGTEADLLATPEMPDAVETIERLTRRFGGRVWLVSKCGPRVQARTLRWLAGHRFFARTGVDPANVRFCRARADKRGHCLDLGLTHFIDDRLDVHSALAGAVTHRYLFGAQRSPAPSGVALTPTWADAERLVLGTLAVITPEARRVNDALSQNGNRATRG